LSIEQDNVVSEHLNADDTEARVNAKTLEFTCPSILSSLADSCKATCDFPFVEEEEAHRGIDATCETQIALRVDNEANHADGLGDSFRASVPQERTVG
jgi:hypothetical protein